MKATSSPAPSPKPSPSKNESESRSEAPAPQKPQTRHAHLFVTHFDAWSVMKNAFMLALAIGIVMIVAVSLIWFMLSASGTLDSVAATVADVAGSGPSSIDVKAIFSFSSVVGTTAILAGLEVVLTTALVTLFAFLYNIAVGITGGLQITLTDES